MWERQRTGRGRQRSEHEEPWVACLKKVNFTTEGMGSEGAGQTRYMLKKSTLSVMWAKDSRSADWRHGVPFEIPTVIQTRKNNERLN